MTVQILRDTCSSCERIQTLINFLYISKKRDIVIKFIKFICIIASNYIVLPTQCRIMGNYYEIFHIKYISHILCWDIWFSQRHNHVSDQFTTRFQSCILHCHIALGSHNIRLVKSAVIFFASLESCMSIYWTRKVQASTLAERGKVRCMCTPSPSFWPIRARKC